jgi:hypothetical protein
VYSFESLEGRPQLSYLLRRRDTVRPGGVDATIHRMITAPYQA